MKKTNRMQIPHKMQVYLAAILGALVVPALTLAYAWYTDRHRSVPDGYVSVASLLAKQEAACGRKFGADREQCIVEFKSGLFGSYAK